MVHSTDSVMDSQRSAEEELLPSVEYPISPFLPKHDGWKVKREESEVTLTMDVEGGEKVVITLYINKSVEREVSSLTIGLMR